MEMEFSFAELHDENFFCFLILFMHSHGVAWKWSKVIFSAMFNLSMRRRGLHILVVLKQARNLLTNTKPTNFETLKH